MPIPAKIHAKAKKASTLEELEEIFPGLICLIDVSEQQIRRPKRKDMEKSHYSGKAGRHTAKVRHTVNTNGLIGFCNIFGTWNRGSDYMDRHLDRSRVRHHHSP